MPRLLLRMRPLADRTGGDPRVLDVVGLDTRLRRYSTSREGRSRGPTDPARPASGRLGAQGDGESAREGVQQKHKGRLAAARILVIE
ncbi:hypothetical protein NB037_10790 [Rathayibacter sp. ZW T2_19]|uniref:Uncharacterized protein n=1 Tax=Rathayibacter rubneri TaxID=2950106 RepID=A0A9X2DXD0_9MICO|nr:hypothetical protein [Rathayibacter rubneri]MCM6762902.1 hypothetical protein [Rathayibacter rubneri]